MNGFIGSFRSEKKEPDIVVEAFYALITKVIPQRRNRPEEMHIIRDRRKVYRVIRVCVLLIIFCILTALFYINNRYF